MRRILLCLFLAALACANARSQTIQHPEDASAVWLDSIRIEMVVPNGSPVDSSTPPSSARSEWTMHIWRTSSGRVDYVIDIGTIAFSGDCSPLDTIATVRFFELLDYRTITEGVTGGFTTCGPSVYSRVYQNHCVIRSGNGVNTSFDECSSAPFEFREYMVTCVNAEPIITNVPRTVGGCGDDCEPTCPTEEGGQLQ